MSRGFPEPFYFFVMTMKNQLKYEWDTELTEKAVQLKSQIAYMLINGFSTADIKDKIKKLKAK